MRPILIAALATLSACSTVPGTAPRPTGDWRSTVTDADRSRLAGWRTAFTRALDQARKSGHGAEIDAEGALLKPDAALGPTPIPNGTYRCRTIKVGAKSEGMLDYIAYPAFNCRIQQERNLQGFAKLSGSQRQVGLIFPDSAIRQAFLGTLELGDEARPMQYGVDPDRDVAGWVERVGDNRWRLIMPYPRFESTLDVLELVPAN
ncbi:DUF4893 domain-containing protein [Sphingomonas jaspsi]|uniref:DUF4893 domain-containing protein n=1 Tax=Sphingomonas jaspsi TaxID=392409 RepID=UPI0004B8CD67|nr:DUF4893 domain-containing protein [Sphingomonas jaspsi]